MTYTSQHHVELSHEVGCQAAQLFTHHAAQDSVGCHQPDALVEQS